MKDIPREKLEAVARAASSIDFREIRAALEMGVSPKTVMLRFIELQAAVESLPPFPMEE